MPPVIRLIGLNNYLALNLLIIQAALLQRHIHRSFYTTATPPKLLPHCSMIPRQSQLHHLLSPTRATLHHARDCLHKAQESQRAYADSRRRDAQFQTGDLVLLSTTHFIPDNIPTTKRKLLIPFIGPYKIVNKISRLNYCLALPASFKIHDVFHVSQLKAYNNPYSFPGRDSVPPPASFKIGSEDFYHVDRLLAHRRRYGRDFYLVSWKGYSADHNSWEPASHITPDLVQAFYAHQA